VVTRALLCLVLVVAAVVAPSASRARSSVDDPCIKPGERAVEMRASDGAVVYGVEIGTGTTGVVFGHQFLSDHCEFIDFARELAGRGYRTLTIDFRGYGGSSGGEGRRLDRDIAAAVTQLRSDGATRVKLVGASMGGTAVLVASAQIKPAVNGVVSLSAPARYLGLDAVRAVRSARVPVRFVAARRDFRFAVDARTLMKASKARNKAMLMVAGGRHGSSVLDVPWAKASVQAFLAR
jgi:pimeloyl-ACP methyl ester carboxylesterase